MEKTEKKVNVESETINNSLDLNDVVKPMGQLTNEEIKKLSIMDVTLVKYTNRKTHRSSYSYKFNLCGLTLSETLDESEYKLILLKKNILEEKDEISTRSYVRFVQGTTSNGYTYHSVQLFFVDKVYKALFLKNSQYELIKAYEDKKLYEPINWLVSSAVADDNVVLSDEDVAGF